MHPKAPSAVSVKVAQQVIPTYLPHLPDRNPMFLDGRVYQGSSGKAYPLPFTDRIAETKTERAWQVILLENEFLEVMILPELGGRIHALRDKTNGYDLIYRQDSIKPALVGLAGPWVSRGIEFNWPQHHRPATFLPVDLHVENEADGAVTVWCSDHDPLTRMKGMHGIRLRAFWKRRPGWDWGRRCVRAGSCGKSSGAILPTPERRIWREGEERGANAGKKSLRLR